MARRSLRPHLNQIRGWVRQGRTDAWIAHQLEVTVQQIEAFKRENDLAPDGDAGDVSVGADFDDEIDLRAEAAAPAGSQQSDLARALGAERLRWESAAESVSHHPWGSVLRSPSLPRVFDANLLWVDSLAGLPGAPAVIDESERALVGFHHRKLFVPDSQTAAALASPA